MIYVFIVFGFVGWLIDSGYRSLTEHKWTAGGFSILPFTPSYGLGAVILFAIAPTILELSIIPQVLILGFVFALYEYVCGHFSVLVMKRRLWDYSKGFMNLHGHTDLLHAVYWAGLSFATLHLLYPRLVTFFL